MTSSHDISFGHNGGPDLEPTREPEDDDPTGRLLFVKWAWTRAHDEAWKTPPLDILRFRVARAEAAGLTYREYMLQLLDTGRYPQAQDGGTGAGAKRPLAKPGPPAHLLRQPSAQVSARASANRTLQTGKTIVPPVTSSGIADTPAAQRSRRPVPQAQPPQTLLKVHK
jgi:hypothetical protein